MSGFLYKKNMVAQINIDLKATDWVFLGTIPIYK